MADYYSDVTMDEDIKRYEQGEREAAAEAALEREKEHWRWHIKRESRRLTRERERRETQ